MTDMVVSCFCVLALQQVQRPGACHPSLPCNCHGPVGEGVSRMGARVPSQQATLLWQLLLGGQSPTWQQCQAAILSICCERFWTSEVTRELACWFWVAPSWLEWIFSFWIHCWRIIVDSTFCVCVLSICFVIQLSAMPCLMFYLLSISQAELMSKTMKSKGVVITSYNSLVKHKDRLLRYNWHYIILDEGHKIRNPDTQIAAVCKSVSIYTLLDK